MNVTIPCPACSQGQIIIAPQLLLSGSGFSCTSCDAKLTLDQSSEKDYQKGFQEFSAFQNQVNGIKQQGETPTVN